LEVQAWGNVQMGRTGAGEVKVFLESQASLKRKTVIAESAPK